MLEITCPDSINKPGFDIVIKNERFQCAFITYSDIYACGPIKEMKRHNITDEIFVLLNGEATLFIYEEGREIEKTVLEKNKAYNVTKGTWHYLAVSDDACLFVTERSDCVKEDTEILNFS